MKLTQFQLILNTPVPLKKNDIIHRYNGKLYMNVISIRAKMRQYLRELFTQKGVDLELEKEIFGGVWGNYAIKSSFTLSIPLASIDEYRIEVVPVGTKFTGELCYAVHPDNLGDFTIRLLLLATQNLRDGVSCVIKFCDGSISSEQLYHSRRSKCETDKSKDLQQLIDSLVISYFKIYPDKLNFLQPRKFEEFVASLLRSEGFEVELTPATHDGGFDVLAVKYSSITGKHTYLVECKQYSKHRKIGIEIIRNLMWVIHHNNATKGIIVTTSSFSKDAQREAVHYSNKIILHDYDSLTQWIENVKLSKY